MRSIWASHRRRFMKRADESLVIACPECGAAPLEGCIRLAKDNWDDDVIPVQEIPAIGERFPKALHWARAFAYQELDPLRKAVLNRKGSTLD